MAKVKLTQGQIAKLKNQQRAERAFRQQMDDYLESQGLLKYQTGGTINEAAIQQNLAGIGISAYQNYTLKDGDTLGTVAQTTGVTPEQILKDNPELKTPQTGTVIKVPTVGGLPSNAALGGTSPNIQGVNSYMQSEKGVGGAGLSLPYNLPRIAEPTVGSEEWRIKNITPRPSGMLGGGYVTPSFKMYGAKFGETGLGGGYATSSFKQGLEQMYGPIASQQQQLQEQSYTPGRGKKPRSQYSLASTLNQLILKMGGDYTPTEKEMAMLLQFRKIKPASVATSPGGGSGYFGGSYRYGGGGGGGGTPRYNPRTGKYVQPRAAFSTGSGFGGLVNWRI